MAFFKFRKADGEGVSSPAQPQSVEAMRKRAKQRLIGAAVLVLAGIIGFPLVFDSQPRPIAVDIPIDIPDRARDASAPPPGNIAAGAVEAVARPASAAAAPAPAVAPAVAAPAAAAPPAASPQAVAPVAAAASTPPAASPVPAAPAAGASVPTAPRPQVPASSASRAAAGADGARTLAEGKPPAAAEGRFVVQVGAFADAARATAARQKLERAGIKTYTHVAETREGKRIRVRAGPFSTRAEADRAADKIKGLDLPAAILVL